jgi:hypothetical protein
MAAPSSLQVPRLVARSQGEHADQPKLILLLRITNHSDTSTSWRETVTGRGHRLPSPQRGREAGVRGILLCGINSRNSASAGTSGTVREFGCALGN